MATKLVAVGFSRFPQQSADVSGRLGPHGWELGCWCTPVNKYIQVSYQTASPESSSQDLSVQPCAQADTADMFGKLTAVQSLKALQPAWSHLRQRVLRISQCNVHNTRTSALLLHSIVMLKILPRSSDIMLSLALGTTGPLDTDQCF